MSGVLVWALPIGAALDAVLGDPQGWPHPVRAIGALIVGMERFVRRVLNTDRTTDPQSNPLSQAGRTLLLPPPLWGRVGVGGSRKPVIERAAGVLLAAVVVGVTTLSAWAVMRVCDRLGPFIALLGRSLLIYWGLAARGLGREALLAAEAPDLSAARAQLARIVGRDTATLDRAEVCRACVETVAENCNDAVVAPLFWFALGGPVGLWAYKAISTLDSMVGYRNARYRYLGWASALLDDLAAFLPARLTWLLIALAARFAGEHSGAAFRVGWRDGRKHPSPNAAWGEAAMAGALGIQLGGPATYAGVPSLKPRLGDESETIGPATVRRAVRLMYIAAVLALLLAWGFRLGVLRSP